MSDLKLESVPERGAGWTLEEKEQLRSVARRMREERPTAEQLVASGEYVGPMPFGVLQDTLLAMAELKKARDSLGFSLTDVSEMSGIDRATISKLENGKANPTLLTIGRYAASLGMRVRLVLEEITHPEPEPESVG